MPDSMIDSVKTKLSKIVFVASWVATLLTVAASLWWALGLALTEHPQDTAAEPLWRLWGSTEDEARQTAGLSVIAFLYLVAPVLGGISILDAITGGHFI
jgi:lysylphosphatidylglycerol synthetase-like protein (DUF2156 family)